MEQLLKKLPKGLVNFFLKNYIILLLIIVTISYGQMLGMYFWQDDNALIVKLEDIDKPVGYFSPGPLGVGITKYAAIPFIPIHFLFGTNPVPYFAFLFILYFLTTIVVYKLFSLILGQVAGRVSSFLFAAGYVVSDGVWRMANSATTSISLIFVGLCLYFYYKFTQLGKWFWYPLALLFYYLSVEVAVVRAHYFFIIIVFFELTHYTFRSLPKSIFFSLIRLAPFFYIFNKLVVGSDARVGKSTGWVWSFLRGEFYNYYGFITSLGYLVVPDWLINYFLFLQSWIDKLLHVHFPFLALLLIIPPFVIIIFSLKNHPLRKTLLPLFIGAVFIWYFLSKRIFIAPLLSPSSQDLFVTGLGGMILILSLLYIVLSKNRWIFSFLIIWVLVNIAAYSTYYPIIPYGTIERYLAHSFMALVGIFGLIYITFSFKSKIGKLTTTLIIILGLGNLIHAVLFENYILRERSIPAKEFYKQLKAYVPEVKKGDIFYFDISSDAQSYYNHAISTAMMPESGAIAWRYGIYRYDIKLSTDFDEFTKIIQNDKPIDQNLHTFWYSKNGLVDTSDTMKRFVKAEQKLIKQSGELDLPQLSKVNTFADSTRWSQQNLNISFKKPIESTTPVQLVLSLTADPLTNLKNFPVLFESTSLNDNEKLFWSNTEYRNISLEYELKKNEIINNSKFTVSSEWQHNLVKNLSDHDITTLWQSDRTQWGVNEITFIQVELPVIEEISKAVWINGYSHNTPTNYSIEVSLDNKNWQQVKKVSVSEKIDNREPQVVDFAPVTARYVKMVINKTLNDDSPVVAEFWVVPSKYSNLDIKMAERFLQNPYALIPSNEAYNDTLRMSQHLGKVRLHWQSEKTNSWQSAKATEFNIIYDGNAHDYRVIIPAGGLNISKFRISDFTLPGSIVLNKAEIYRPSFEEIANP